MDIHTTPAPYQQGRDLALEKVASVDSLIAEGELSLSGALHTLAAFHDQNLAGRCLVWQMEEYTAAYHQTLRDYAAALRSLID